MINMRLKILSFCDSLMLWHTELWNEKCIINLSILISLLYAVTFVQQLSSVAIDMSLRAFISISYLKYSVVGLAILINSWA